MKKGDIITLTVDGVAYPGKAYGYIGEGADECKIVLDRGIPGQEVNARLIKKRKKQWRATVLSVTRRADDETCVPCPMFGRCGGCAYLTMPYDDQLTMKTDWVKGLLADAGISGAVTLPTIPSPVIYRYRNKMEFSFGDEVPGGALRLGLHERGRAHNVLSAEKCCLVSEDFGEIVRAVSAYFAERHIPYYHKRSHEGYLRHLVIREGKTTGEILINLVTTSGMIFDGGSFSDMLLKLTLKGRICGIIHTINDGVADVVRADSMETLYGEAMLHEHILGLSFDISPFSFFQTNTYGAEALYTAVRDSIGMVWDTGNSRKTKPVIFDLYCGTGTIAQIVAKGAKKVIGIELVEEAVAAAKRNAAVNGLDNCEFIAGDVLTKVDELSDKPDIIVLEPPREGIHPKAIFKIIDFNPEIFVYVSCKASSLAVDLPFFIQAGYTIHHMRCVDMFPHTPHVETICCLYRQKKYSNSVPYDPKDADYLQQRE